MLIDLENIVGVSGYFIDDQTYEIWSFKRYKEGRKIKLRCNNYGYLYFTVSNEGKLKNIWYHQLIVRLFIDPSFDSKIQQIDHLDHNKLNNSIDNLKVVTRSQNELNRSIYNGRQAIYLDNIGENISVNEDHEIYYSKTFDKFYRYVQHINKYRQLIESKHYASMRITYNYNNKSYHINCTKFRQSIAN